RRPCYWYYQSFAELERGGLLADSVATMRSLNVTAGGMDC
ncbi:NADH-quinone oxidoreductase subunit D, partial [Leptospira interrogans serovar Pomona]|nr:NADH-quinone oxidoreductase subunit D [Leptospira interrogans serovar Pomona]